MSKQFDPIPVNYSSVHWFHDTNIRKGDSFGDPRSDINFKIDKDGNITGDTRDGQVANLWNGWDVTQGVVTVSKATKEQALAALAERRAEVKRFKSMPSSMPLGIMLEELWGLTQGAKPVAIEWIGNNCFRRSEGVKGVLLRRYNEAAENRKGKPDLTYTLYVVEKQFQGEAERLDDHLRENGMKDAGRKPLTPTDYFFIAREYIRIKGVNAREADLVRNGVKRGEAQRAFALATIDAKYPELHLADGLPLLDGDGKPVLDPDTKKPLTTGRVLLPKPDKDDHYTPGLSRVDVKALRHADLVRMLKGFKPGTTDDEAKNRIRGGLDAKFVEGHIGKAMTGTTVKAMTIADVIDALNKSNTKVLRYLAHAISQHNGHFVSKVDEYADKMNKLVGDSFDLDKIAAEEEAAAK